MDKFIMELDAQLNQRKVFLQITAAARRYLAAKGYDQVISTVTKLYPVRITRMISMTVLTHLL